jgi:hypothetical protein
MRNISLIIDDCLPIFNAKPDAKKPWPWLHKLLKTEGEEVEPYSDGATGLYHHLGGAGRLPLAALVAHKFRLPPARAWLLAQPVECAADIRSVYCEGYEHLDITAQEAAQLIDTINAHIAPNDMRLYAPEPDNWLLALQQPAAFATFDLEEVIGQDIADYVPKNASQQWQQLFVEIEMLLHQHPVNQLRQEQGRPVINACWLWGEGELPVLSKQADTTVASGQDLCGVLAEWVDGQIMHPKADLDATIAAAPPGTEHLIVVIDQNDLSDASNDEYLAALEQQWLKPVFALMHKKECKSAQFYLGENRCYDLEKSGFKIKIPFLSAQT